MGSRPVPCDPGWGWIFSRVWRGRDLAIESHSSFQRDQRSAMADIFCEGFIQQLGLFLENS